VVIIPLVGLAGTTVDTTMEVTIQVAHTETHTTRQDTVLHIEKEDLLNLIRRQRNQDITVLEILITEDHIIVTATVTVLEILNAVTPTEQDNAPILTTLVVTVGSNFLETEIQCHSLE